MHVTGSIRMVVIEMDLKAWIVKTFLQPVKAASLAGVDYDEAGYRRQVNVLDLFEVIQVADLLGQEIAQPPLHGPGKDQFSIEIQFPGSHHGGQPVKIRVDMGGDNFHRFNYTRLGLVGKISFYIWSDQIELMRRV